MSRPSITILIPAHNEEAMIAACIDSCLTQSRPADQIIVVNDGSIDRTGEILASYGDAIQVITLEQPTGNKSRAQEVGIAQITTELFIATDGDTILDRHFVREVERVVHLDPEVGAVAGYVKSMRHNMLTALREIEYVIGQDLYKLAQSYLNYVLVIPGCAGAFRTALFHTGVLTFEHDTLTEDLDLTYRLHAGGYRIAFATRAFVYTQDPPTLHSYVNQMRRWYGGGWQNLLKHREVLTMPNAALLLTLAYVEGLLVAGILLALPLINLSFFLTVLPLIMLAFVVVGCYAAVRRRRLDLLLWSPFALVTNVINAAIFLERFVVEVVLRRKTMVWFHPRRVSQGILKRTNRILKT
ncbi:glycosyltransferase [Patescibacteria group bacterium]|jgi:cellulose synthase/poly-beta-1,6-N-acetylglucosamine synthase-like glycosyltransferase|nr:glycosyltransferase [Patescibacteria group bacterium]